MANDGQKGSIKARLARKKSQRVLVPPNFISTSDWGTPLDLFEALNREFNFTLDAAASKWNAKCEKYFTAQDDGLKQPWAPERVFLNPPYKDLKFWIAKAYHESQKGALVVCLIPADTSVPYWHTIIFEHASEIRWVRGRLKFVRPSGKPSPAPFTSVIVIFEPGFNGPPTHVHDPPPPPKVRQRMLT